MDPISWVMIFIPPRRCSNSPPFLGQKRPGPFRKNGPKRSFHGPKAWNPRSRWRPKPRCWGFWGWGVDLCDFWGKVLNSKSPRNPKNQRLQPPICRWIWMCFVAGVWDLQSPPVTWDPGWFLGLSTFLELNRHGNEASWMVSMGCSWGPPTWSFRDVSSKA